DNVNVYIGYQLLRGHRIYMLNDNESLSKNLKPQLLRVKDIMKLKSSYILLIRWEVIASASGQIEPDTIEETMCRPITYS
ncbi:unnamed protein product, partial [Ceratitis capitata]